MAGRGRLCLAVALLATNVACTRLVASGDPVTGSLDAAAVAAPEQVAAVPDQAAAPAVAAVTPDPIVFEDGGVDAIGSSDLAASLRRPAAGSPRTRPRVVASGDAPAQGAAVDYLASMNRVLDRHSTDARRAVRSMCEGC